MKICQIVYTYPPHATGGADIYAQRISAELAKNGNEIVVITTKPYEGLQSLKPSVDITNNIKVYRFYPLNIFSWIYSAKKPIYFKVLWQGFDIWNPHSYLIIRNILKKEKPDVVHLHTPIWISLSVFDAVKNSKIPSVLTLHDYLLLCRRIILLHGNGNICNKPKPICQIYRKLSKMIVKSIPNVVTAPSQFIMDMLINDGFFKESECMKLPLGIDVLEKNQMKNYKTIDILYTGQLAKHKGVHILIKAFKKIKDTNLHLHITGKGSYTDELKKLAYGDERITFYGFVSEEKLTELYEMANISVVPSVWYDNSPVVIYESFRAGTPVIGSDIGGIPELVIDGYNGYLFEAGNVDELERTLIGVIHSKPKMQELSENALASAEKYKMEEHIAKLEQIYQNLVK